MSEKEARETDVFHKCVHTHTRKCAHTPNIHNKLYSLIKTLESKDSIQGQSEPLR